MTIREMIKQLKEYENQQAIVTVIVGNEDDDVLDTSDIELFSDTSDGGYIEIFISDKHLK